MESFLPYETEEERLELIVKDLTEALGIQISQLTRYSTAQVYIRCIVCGNPKLARYTGLLKKQGLTCSDECNHRLRSFSQKLRSKVEDPAIKLKRKLGLEAFNKDPQRVAEKIRKKKETTLVRYGVENASQCSEVKSRISVGLKRTYEEERDSILQKRRSTNVGKYGVENFLNSKQGQARIRKVNQEKYGVDFRFQSPLVRQEAKVARERTLMSEYGVTNASKSAELVAKRILSFRRHRLDNGKNYSKEFWLNQTYGYGCVLDPSQILPDSWGPGTNHQFVLICGTCKRHWSPQWRDVIVGNTQTCGCLVGVSVAELRVYEYVKQLCNDTIHTHKIDNVEVDIFIPSRNVAIEYNGLYWHRAEVRQQQDAAKAKRLRELGIRYVGIFEDEWLQKEEMVKGYLATICGEKKKVKQLRPQQVKVVFSKNDSQIREFLQKYHYGGGKTSLSEVWSVYDESTLIGILGCGAPTRNQIKEDVELKRICSHPDYHVPGLWSFLLKNYVAKHYPVGTDIVSFSDNRRDTGNLYKAIGFTEVGQVRPDYYWCKGQQRFHKAKFQNVTKIQDELTENEYMTGQGYFKVYDCGKTKWSIKL